MKTTHHSSLLLFTLLTIGLVVGTQHSDAARRYRASYPRSDYRAPVVSDRRDVRTPAVGTPAAPARGTVSPGAVAPGRGTAGPGAPGNVATRTSPGYIHTLPADYERRVYRGWTYYYTDGYYYYAYTNDGPVLYVQATVVNGAPTIPPRPYVYSLPTGYTIKTFNGVNYYDYLGYYYYVYYINGRAVYVLAKVVNGVPTVPPAPY
jgi:hypothetical protein